MILTDIFNRLILLALKTMVFLQDDVIRKIELIGEAAKRLSFVFWEQY